MEFLVVFYAFRQKYLMVSNRIKDGWLAKPQQDLICCEDIQETFSIKLRDASWSFVAKRVPFFFCWFLHRSETTAGLWISLFVVYFIKKSLHTQKRPNETPPCGLSSLQYLHMGSLCWAVFPSFSTQYPKESTLIKTIIPAFVMLFFIGFKLW